MNKHNSTIIRENEEKIKKSRRRLAGSIVVLLIALILLLKISSTAQNHNINIVIESNTVKNTIAIESIPIESSIIIESTESTMQLPDKYIAETNNKELEKKPQINNQTKKQTPEEILNGSNENQLYYIQVAAAHNFDRMKELQNKLSMSSIFTTIHVTNTDKGILYRLRTEPTNESEANKMLKQLEAIGYNSILSPA